VNSLIKLILFLLIVPISLRTELVLAQSKEKMFEQPLREFALILTEEGYYPNRLMAHTGEKVRFFVTSTKKASDCFLLQDHKIFLSAKFGEVSEGEVTFKESGKYKFYCPSSKHEGFVTVVDKASNVEDQKREIASEKEKPAYWMPRDYDE
jgi:plastocyanin